MKKFLLSLCFSVLAVFSVAGCVAPDSVADTVGDIPAGITAEQFQDAVKGSCVQFNWVVEEQADGSFYATQTKTKWYAKVHITSDGTTYRISHVESRGLKYDAEKQTIHHHYTLWATNLKQGIDSRLSVAN